MSVLYGAMAWLIVFPVAAFAIGAVFVLAGRRRGKRLAVVVGAAWAAYGVYESLMYLRVLCGGECNIRVDLLVIYPCLAIASIAALVSLVRGRPAA